jgi:hypothetical protein
MTPKKRVVVIPTLDELQHDNYKETLEHIVERLMKKTDDVYIFNTARDFDSYQSDDDDEPIIHNY